ncbi:MAG: PhzF family phenazine biosynthesis protein [Firmicutes bacterium]|jgi:trans-2,3-dihydro-3-hydroxyanthranilate isomerase|nr:PhzF family phenazine biosynthesis protein [Bacillota bacterium]
MSRRFYIVDVFAEEKYGGNQLAVVRDTEGLGDGDMRKIAREMNFSETTFIVAETPTDGGYDVRIFTPERELPFAGHPTLGTAYMIRREMIGRPVQSLALNLKVGRIEVTFDAPVGGLDRLWMRQVAPSFGEPLAPGPVLEALGLGLEDWDDRYPVQEVSTGLPFIITPVKDLAAVKRARTMRERFAEVVRHTEAKDILLFCPETYSPSNHLNVRVFAEYEGVPEDPATGSANGCLAGYLVRHGYFGTAEIDVRVEQGYEIGRPSLLLLRAKEAGGTIDVRVGGGVIMVAKGELV